MSAVPDMDDDDTKQIELRVDEMRDVPSDKKDLMKLKLRADSQSRQLRQSTGLVRWVIGSVLTGSGGVVIAIVTAIWYMATFVAEVRAEITALREDVTELRHDVAQGEDR